MSKRETSHWIKRISHIGLAILQLPKRITEPSRDIKEEGERRRARFLSVAIFAATCIFPILQITSEVTQGIPFYSGSTIFLAALYLLSRTKYLRLSSALAIIFSAIFPFVILIQYPVWTSHNLAFQILTWPVFAVIMGSQLLTKNKEASLIICMNTGLILIILLHPGIVFFDAIEYIGVSIALQTLIWFTNWTTEYFTEKIEKSNRTIEARRRELEIYTSLLRHDLSNDIQMVLGGIELAQMTSDEQKKQSSFLESTLAAAERMKSLIHIFSVSEEELENDFVTILGVISQRAEIAFKGMSVHLDIEENVKDREIFYNKLTALAFENLLRNAAQHAGNNPTVTIKLAIAENTLDIKFEDDGPGVSPEIQEQLFNRGVTTGSKGKGLGLYLTRAIIETEGGTIALIENDQPGCCFHIQLPINSIFK